MVKVKICGITNRVDAMNAAELGADAIGFVFSKSPRQVTPGNAKKIIQAIPPYVTTVGLFVNEPMEKVQEIMNFCKLNIAQLHGQESPEYCKKLGYRIIKTFHIKDKQSLFPISKYSCSGVLFDTFVEDKQGGTGKIFNWEIVSELYCKYYIILAGGLNADNIQEAIKVVNPYAVDVSSGVEKLPGKKDYEKLKQFITRAKTTNI